MLTKVSKRDLYLFWRKNMVIKSKESETDGIETIANLMIIAARTAPKAKGIDTLQSLIMTGDDKNRLVDYMNEYGRKMNLDFFIRNAKQIKDSPVVVLLGVKGKPIYIDGCDFCGFNGCKESIKHGAYCTFQSINLGIAIGSAVSVASLHGCDNRVMYSPAKAALDLGYFQKDVKIAVAIPLSATGKNKYFDVKSNN